VGWQSYRDAWLSEGFAEFSAALESQQTGGMKKYVDFWEKARAQIFKKRPGNAYANWEMGPISQGWRIEAGERMAGAYSSIIYEKGAYVLHMLRMLMRDPKAKDADERFIAMMKDFTATYAGKDPSTADFQAVVERHLSKPMDLTGNGKMDWFFKQWVFGTEIPRYRYKIDVQDAGAGSYRLAGEVTQSEVSPDFRAYVPLYVDFAKGATVSLGGVALVGNQTVPIAATVRLPEKPKAVRINALMDVLSRD
jgi:aminopeptidase N